MGIRVSPGFTIIEVMLFLAVTGLMMAGIMSSATSSLNAQRYRDGVEAIRSAIAVEYDKVYSLTNSRESGIDPCPVGTPQPRGTSECFYTGRLVELTDSGTKLKVSPVVARSINENGATVLERFLFERIDGVGEARNLEWSMSAVEPRTDTPAQLAILILRSPDDGAVLTYNILAPNPAGPIPYGNLGLRMSDGVSRSEGAMFCIADLEGPLDPAIRQAIVINKSATSAADIETRMGDGDPEC